MIKKIWKDLFFSFEAEGIHIACSEDTEQIIELFIEDKIDIELFILNIDVLFRRGMPTFEELYGINNKNKPTKSILNFISLYNRPRGVPLWFLAGYPDVIQWFNNKDAEYTKIYGHDNDNWLMEAASLLGLDVKDENLDEKQIENIEGYLRPKYYKNLTRQYVKTTQKKLEMAVEESSVNNVYSGSELLNLLGTESNFTLVAECTTKYYLELYNNYKDRFDSEEALLAAAGILDAQQYIFVDKTIDLLEIINIGKESVLLDGDVLLNFIINLVIKLIGVHMVDMNISDIKNAVINQEKAILKAIEKTKESYVGEPYVFFGVENVFFGVKDFMNSAKFEPYRKIIGIK